MLYEKIKDQIRPIQKSCPKNCLNKCKSSLFVTNRPLIFSMVLTWEENLEKARFERIIQLIKEEIDICDIFDNPKIELRKYRLVGMILYNLYHYICYFFIEKKGKWFSFDDSLVNEIGHNFEEIRQRCLRGNFKPTLLFYIKM